MENEEFIEDDPEVEPATRRIWKDRNDPLEPGSSQASSKETKYRPIKQRKQNKMPFKGKPKAYKEYPELGTTCPYYSEITDIYCRKSIDITCSDYRTTDPKQFVAVIRPISAQLIRTSVLSTSGQKRRMLSTFIVDCQLKRRRYILI